MLCDVCQINEATVYLTKIVNGSKTQIHLCESCASKSEKYYLNTDFSFQNLLSSMLDIALKQPEQRKGNNLLICTKCQTTYQQFRKQGKLGCAECYNVFKKVLPTILRPIQGNLNHVGKVPKESNGDLIIKRKIKDLKYRLKRAVEEEAFEEAARLRDKIKDLQKGDELSC